MLLLLTAPLVSPVNEETMAAMAFLDCLANPEAKAPKVIKAHLENQDVMDKMVEEDPKEILDSLVPKAFQVDKEEMVPVDLPDRPEPWLKEKKFPGLLEHRAETVCRDLPVHRV